MVFFDWLDLGLPLTFILTPGYSKCPFIQAYFHRYLFWHGFWIIHDTIWFPKSPRKIHGIGGIMCMTNLLSYLPSNFFHPLQVQAFHQLARMALCLETFHRSSGKIFFLRNSRFMILLTYWNYCSSNFVATCFWNFVQLKVGGCILTTFLYGWFPPPARAVGAFYCHCFLVSSEGAKQ